METTHRDLSSVYSKDLLQPAKMTDLLRERRITTPLEAIACGVPSVRRSVKMFGYKETAAAIVMQIERLQMLLNVTKPMQPAAVAETAKMTVDLIVADDVEINLADVEIVFRRAASGYYGKFFGGFGSADVVNWFTLYLVEKADAYCILREREASVYKHDCWERSCGSREAERLANHAAHLEYLKMKNEK